MSRTSSSFWLSSLLAVGAFAQSDVLTVAPVAKVSAKRNESTPVRLMVKLKPGYHTNSNTPSEDYLIPLRLTWDAAPLATEAVKFPAPHLEKYEFSEKPLSVFTGDFAIETQFKAPANAPTGLGIAKGKLRYQACSLKACLPPKTVPVEFTYEIR
ncbi:MAG: protein-disulfide reductase DsbD family protein [Bryobacteraceae bacterium]|nr:protein-disulfide reductase DsbD family protein [Bryobacteraceae bacterium]